MKTPSFWLKKSMPVVIVFFTFTIGLNEAFGQNISRQEANKQARLNRSESGFQRIEFSKSTLLEILSDANGIRLYSGLQNGAGGSTVLMAIGIDKEGNELGSEFRQSDVDGREVITKSAVKDLQVTNIQGLAQNRRFSSLSKVKPFTTAFGSEDLINMLNAPGVEGISFLPAKKTDASGNEALTLIAQPIGGAETDEMPSLMAPCPPECFGFG